MQAWDAHGQGRGWLAWRDAPPADRPQRARAERREVLREQRAAWHQRRDPASGRLFALESGTMLRGPEERDRPGPVRGTPLSGIETSLDRLDGELPVPVARAPGTSGGKTRS